MNRREFPRSVKAEIVKRAMDEKGRIRCEGCYGVVRRFEIDHVIAEALVVDKTKALTAKDGQLLGYCCHRGEDGKTAHDVTAIAKSKRPTRKLVAGIGKRSSRPIPGSKASGWRKPFNGPPERRY
jgi:hypothetical protein